MDGVINEKLEIQTTAHTRTVEVEDENFNFNELPKDCAYEFVYQSVDNSDGFENPDFFSEKF